MARKKVKLAKIDNEAARKITFMKRKRGLLKKVSELCVLCDVTACAFIYGPYDAHPDIWPNPVEVGHLLNKFKSMPEYAQSKNTLNQEAFLRHQLMKVDAQLKRHLKDNWEMETTQLMSDTIMGKGLHHVAIEELCDMAWLMETKTKKMKERIEELKMVTLPIPPPQWIPANERVVTSLNPDIMDPIERHRWLIETTDSLYQQQHHLGRVQEPATPYISGYNFVMPYGDGASMRNQSFN